MCTTVAPCQLDTCDNLPGTLAVLAVLSTSPFYHLSILDVMHVSKDTRHSIFFILPKTAWAWVQG